MGTHKYLLRSQIVANALFIPVPDQTPRENLRLILSVQIPPLPLPVSATTPPNPLNAQMSLENITHVQPEIYRVAWVQAMFPTDILSAERWSALSVVETSNGNRTLYESREVYDGSLASTLEALYGQGLQEAFEAQASGLQLRAESSQ